MLTRGGDRHLHSVSGDSDVFSHSVSAASGDRKRSSPADEESSSDPKRLRPSSPSRQDMLDQEGSFADVRRLIQGVYPNQVPAPEAQPRLFASLCEKELSSDPFKEGSVVLPWSEGVTVARQQVQAAAFPEDSGHALKSGKFVPFSRSSARNYPVLGVRQPLDPVQINEDFHRITLASFKPSSVTSQLSDGDLRSFEEFPRRILATANTLDWLCATLGRQLLDLFPEGSEPGASVSVPVDTLTTFRRLLQSASRSVTHIIRDSVTEQANVVLRRRDSHLKKASAKMSESDRSKLRNSGLFSDSLFDRQTLDSAASAIKSEAELLNSVAIAKCMDKVASSSRQQPKAKPKSAQSQSKAQPKPSTSSTPSQTKDQKSTKKDSKGSSSRSGQRSYKGKSAGQKRT